MLDKRNRLTSSKDFQLLYRKGDRVRGSYGMLLFYKDTRIPEYSPVKFGFVVSKKIGNAVKRHMFTRRLRSLTREFLSKYGKELNGYIFSYIAFKEVDEFQDLSKEYLDQVNTAYERTIKDK